MSASSKKANFKKGQVMDNGFEEQPLRSQYVANHLDDDANVDNDDNGDDDDDDDI